jgi:restriction endonuclease Mrr
MEEPYEKRVAIRSASSLALGIARYNAKRRQRTGGWVFSSEKLQSGKFQFHRLHDLCFKFQVDGRKLASLMIDHEVGGYAAFTGVRKVDSDYFEE